VSGAVDLYVQAVQGDADAKDLRKQEAALTKMLTAKITRAKKRKDKASEAEARALLERVRKKK